MSQVQTHLNHETVILIEEHVRRLLIIMGFDQIKVKCVYPKKNDQTNINELRLLISAGDQGRVLIGAHGNNLYALQHIVRSMMRRHLPPTTRVIVDVNDYLLAREKALSNVAELAAKKVIESGFSVTLPVMGASERHTIHTSLSSRIGVKTESLGEEPNRRVVVRPASTVL